MDRLLVNLKEKSYYIDFKYNFLDLADSLMSINAPKKLLIVTDSNVRKLYGDEVCEILEKAGYDVQVTAFDAGEQSKHMNTILSICEACVRHNMDRKSMIIALGGGVVGDMAGFAASIYMRGIDFVQIPTTLLSQSDSSVGGKTGIDFMQGKNILGAFHQPKLVYINVATLKTLPEREFVSGMGEVIKHAIISDEDFFEYLGDNIERIKELDNELLMKMSYKNCFIKADVVSQDEFEHGVRADLNFGHTFGHAIESYYEFKMTHGECVGAGMLAASFVSYKRGYIGEAELMRIKRILMLYGFCVQLLINDTNKVLELMQKDKKKKEGKLKFVLPKKIGSVIHCDDLTENEIIDALEFISK